MSILAVLVLYKVRLDESSSFQSLVRCLSETDSKTVRVLVYDNSPSSMEAEQTTVDWIPDYYHHDPENGGVSAAYNYGLDLAALSGHDWMLLLDQDSEFESNFISELQHAIEEFGAEEVVAIVPEVKGKKSTISPKLVRFGRFSRLRSGTRGRCSRQLTAINCGVAIRTCFLKSVGGFSNKYWLDFLDHWLFSRIFTSGKAVALSGSTITHNLSLERGPLSIARYTNMLDAEAAFVYEERPRLERPVYLVRLATRILKQAVIMRSFGLARITAAKLSQLIHSQLFTKRMQCI